MIQFLTLIATFAGLCNVVHSDITDNYSYYDLQISQDYIYTRPTARDFEFKLMRDDFPGKSFAELKYRVTGLTDHEANILVQHFAFGKDRIAATAVAKHYIQAVKAGDSTEYDDPKIEYPHKPITEKEIAKDIEVAVQGLTNETYSKERVLQYLKTAGTAKLIESFVMFAQFDNCDPVAAQDAARRYLQLKPANELYN